MKRRPSHRRPKVACEGPVRTCVGCGKPDEQAALLRLQFGSDEGLTPVPRARSGRSAYVHKSPACVRGLTRSRLLRRSLGRDPDQRERELLLSRIEAVSGCHPRTTLVEE